MRCDSAKPLRLTDLPGELLSAIVGGMDAETTTSFRAASRRMRVVVDDHPNSGVAFMSRKYEPPARAEPSPFARLTADERRTRAAEICARSAADDDVDAIPRLRDLARDVIALDPYAARDRDDLAVAVAETCCAHVGAALGDVLPTLADLLWLAVPSERVPALAHAAADAVCTPLEVPDADLAAPNALRNLRKLTCAWPDLAQADRERVAASTRAIERDRPHTNATRILVRTLFDVRDASLRAQIAEAVLSEAEYEGVPAAVGLGDLAERLYALEPAAYRASVARRLVEAALAPAPIPGGIGRKIDEVARGYGALPADAARRLASALAADPPIVDPSERDGAVLGLAEKFAALDDADAAIVLSRLPDPVTAPAECELALIAVGRGLHFRDRHRTQETIDALYATARKFADPWKRMRAIGALPGGVSIARLRADGVSLLPPRAP